MQCLNTSDGDSDISFKMEIIFYKILIDQLQRCDEFT